VRREAVRVQLPEGPVRMLGDSEHGRRAVAVTREGREDVTGATRGAPLMSEPQGEPQEAQETRWGDAITPERQEELEALLQPWEQLSAAEQAERGGPFAGIKLTGIDVFYLAVRALAGGLAGDQAAWDVAAARLRSAQNDALLLRILLDLSALHLEGASLEEAHLEGASLIGARLERASLTEAHLEGAILGAAHLEGKVVEPADLERVRRWAKDFPARLAPANLRGAFLNDGTRLNQATLGTAASGYITVADVRWRGVNLAVVRLPPADKLGDERLARMDKADDGTPKDQDPSLDEFQAAVRAHRQFAVALQAQGLNEETARFAYRAQVLQREVLWRQRQVGAYLFAALLAVLAGYGYRLWRIVVAYALIVGVFAASFLVSGLVAGHVSLTGQQAFNALQIGLNAIHGRVFFAQFGLNTLQSWLATAESIVGIVIEGVFVAMLIQRFFGR
jgi:hypothetical protein